MKYFVTGGSGLIGGFLLPKLLEAGHSVFNFDMSEGRDILEIAQIRGALSVHQPDVVIHLAAQSGVEASRDRGFDSLRLNVMGTVNVLESCRDYGVENVVVASSNHVYGKQATAPPYREYSPLNQRDMYSVSKICADVITQAYHHNYGLDTVAVRLTNTYGPGDPHSDHLVPGTIQALLAGNAPALRSAGMIEKSYLYGEDCADAFMVIAQNCEALAGQAVNVVGSEPVSAHRLVAELILIHGRDVAPLVGGIPNDQNDEDMSRTVMDGLGWKPKYTLKEGLQKTYDWFAQRVEVPIA